MVCDIHFLCTRKLSQRHFPLLGVLVPLPILYKVMYNWSREKIGSLVFQTEIPRDGSGLL